MYTTLQVWPHKEWLLLFAIQHKNPKIYCKLGNFKLGRFLQIDTLWLICALLLISLLLHDNNYLRIPSTHTDLNLKSNAKIITVIPYIQYLSFNKETRVPIWHEIRWTKKVTTTFLGAGFSNPLSSLAVFSTHMST